MEGSGRVVVGYRPDSSVRYFPISPAHTSPDGRVVDTSTRYSRYDSYIWGVSMLKTISSIIIWFPAPIDDDPNITKKKDPKASRWGVSPKHLIVSD